MGECDIIDSSGIVGVDLRQKHVGFLLPIVFFWRMVLDIAFDYHQVTGCHQSIARQIGFHGFLIAFL